MRSNNIYVLDTHPNPAQPKIVKVLSGEEVVGKSGLAVGHTVHCAPDGSVMISMLGDGQLEGPGGFLQLDGSFNIVGRWEAEAVVKGQQAEPPQPVVNVAAAATGGQPSLPFPREVTGRNFNYDFWSVVIHAQALLLCS